MKRALAAAGSLALCLSASPAIAAPPNQQGMTNADTTTLPMPPERVVWDRTPLGITLPVNQERQVTFPAPVEVGMPAGLTDVIRTQVVGSTVYWLARKDFSPQRIQVRETATGQVYLVDLSARASASAAPMIISQASASAIPATASDAASGDAPKHEATPAYDYAALTRFAAQSLYAPRRLVPSLPGIYRTPVDERPIDLVRGEAILANPLIAWRSGNLHITAVRLRNQGHSAVILDPRRLRGLWVAATFQHARLLPGGNEADTTVVYLISSKPFEDALRGIY